MIAVNKLLAAGMVQRAIHGYTRLASVIRQKLGTAVDAVKEFGAAVYEQLSAPVMRITRALIFLLREKQFASAAKLIGTAIALGIVTGC